MSDKDLLTLDLKSPLSYIGLENPPLAGAPFEGKTLVPDKSGALTEVGLGFEMEEGEEDFTVMRVIVEGEKAGKTVTYTYDLLDRYDRATKTTSMARTTGYTCTAAARMVLAGLYKRKGVSPPEFVGREKGCWDFIRKQLAERGVIYRDAVS